VVLAIETSDILCSIAFWRDGKTLLEYNLELPMQHARLVGQLVTEGLTLLSGVLDAQSVSVNDVRLVACAVGPGSFTGLRIGLSFAQGFCLAKGLPIVGVSNHQVLAAQAPVGEEVLFSAIEAQRDEVYVARHRRLSDSLTEIAGHEVVAKNNLPEHLPSGSILITNQTLQLEETLWRRLTAQDVRIYNKAGYQAHHLAQIGREKFNVSGADDLQELEPMYVRSFAGVL